MNYGNPLRKRERERELGGNQANGQTKIFSRAGNPFYSFSPDIVGDVTCTRIPCVRLGPISGRIWFKPISMVEENGPRILFECPTLNFRCNLRSVAPEGRIANSWVLYILRSIECAHSFASNATVRQCRVETRNPNILGERWKFTWNRFAERETSFHLHFLLNNSALPMLERTNSEMIHTDFTPLSVFVELLRSRICNLIKRSVIRFRNYLNVHYRFAYGRVYMRNLIGFT